MLVRGGGAEAGAPPHRRVAKQEKLMCINVTFRATKLKQADQNKVRKVPQHESEGEG